MRRESNEFLNLVRHAGDPTAADEARVLSSLKATIAAGVTSSAIVSATLARAPGAPPGVAFGAVGAKLTVVACVAAAVFGTGAPRPADGGSERSAPRTLEVALPPPGTAARAPAEMTAPDTLRPRLPARPMAEPSEVPPRSLAVPPLAVPPLASPSLASPPLASPSRKTARPRATPERARAQSASGLRAELELLERVQLALRRGDGETALRALDAHVTQDRRLAAERAAARVLALCSLGRVAEARDAAAQFAHDHPNSVQSTRVARACTNF